MVGLTKILTDSMIHSVHENIAPTMAKFLAYDIPLCPMSLSTSLAVGVLKGSLGSSPTLVSIPAVKTPKAPPNTNPRREEILNYNILHTSIYYTEQLHNLQYYGMNSDNQHFKWFALECIAELQTLRCQINVNLMITMNIIYTPNMFILQ